MIARCIVWVMTIFPDRQDVVQVLDQYERTVKPSFTQFILPTKQYAHIIVSPQHLSLEI